MLLALVYTPYIWPVLVTAAITASLVFYGLRHRSVPGAVPFSVAMLLCLPWELGAAMGLLCGGPEARIFWFKFQGLWAIPSLSGGLWFALAYADLRRWLVWRTAAVMAIVPGLHVLLMFTAPNLVWSGFRLGAGVESIRSPLGSLFVGYGFALSAVSLLVFGRLFVASPQHRLPVGLCIFGQLAVRALYLAQETHHTPDPQVDLKIVGLAVTGITYALALFPFRLFNLIPIARGTLVEQMREGMLVFDMRQRIVDVNPAAREILGLSAKGATGLDALAVAPLVYALRGQLDKAENTEVEGSLGTDESARTYTAHVSSLKDRGGHPLGHLVLLRDTTEQKRAREREVEHQRALATLRERDRVARELHDGLGQLLGYVKLQVEAVRGQLRRGHYAQAEACLVKLAAVAQDAHADVRDYIVGARAGVSPGAGLVSSLETYVRSFNENFGIRTTLETQPELARRTMDPMVEAQLFRIIQEALTNVRKHARASRADVRLSLQDGRAEATVSDDGAGFEPVLLERGTGQKFGLRFMRERAEEVGGTLGVTASPGCGAQITISVPLRRECS